MTPFEFLAILISVIMGLAIARLVSGIGDLIRIIKSRNSYWIYSVWVFNILILIAGFWWSMYGWSLKEDWNFFYFILLLTFTITLYLLTHFLVPREITLKTNIKEYFLENRKVFFVIQVFALIVDIVETSLLEKEGIRDMPFEYPIVIIALIILSIIGYISNRNRVQAVIAVLWGIILVTYITYGILVL